MQSNPSPYPYNLFSIPAGVVLGRSAQQPILLKQPPVPGFASGNPIAAPAPFQALQSSVDHFLDPKYNLSSFQALGLFTAGFIAIALGPKTLQLLGINTIRELPALKPLIKAENQAKQALHRAWNNPKRKELKERLENLSPALKEMNAPAPKPGEKKLGFDSATLKAESVEEKKLQLYQNYNDPLSSIYRLIQLDPSQGGALLVYAGISILGYLAGSFTQGAKETWVREQETKIRSHLVQRLEGAFRDSIHIKTASDFQRKERVRSQIYQILKASGIPQAENLVQDVPIFESPVVNQHYFYEPTHRSVNFGNLNGTPSYGAPPHPAQTEGSTTSLSQRLAWQRALLLGVGGFTGLVSRKFYHLLADGRKNDPGTGKAAISEGLMLKDLESWSMIGVKSKRNFLVMSGLFAMSAAAALGKAILDGLREIEVTRINARTELAYQQHNWLSQDPLFHNVAEEETVNTQLQQLAKDLPCLKFDRDLLQKRVQTILSNIGRNSAPPYYPMTPTVGLVEARA